MAYLECRELLSEILPAKLQAFSYHEASDGCYVVTPFLDASGDRVAVRVRVEGDSCVIDDSGYVGHLSDYVEPDTSAMRQMSAMLRSFADSFGANLNRDDGTIEMICHINDLAQSVLRFIQLVVSFETSIGYLSAASVKQAPHPRPSLGPRAATRIARSIRPLLRQELALLDVEVSGLAVDNWRVDFLYRPRTLVAHSRWPTSHVAILAVDLAVKYPMSKASDALATALDIKSAHEDFDIRVAVDTHQQNGAVAGAARLLEEHHGDKFRVHPLTTKRLLADFTAQIRAELGAAL